MVNTGTKSGKAAFAAALTVVSVGGSVLSGWLFDLEYLKRIVPGYIAMNPATAVAFILAGISLALFLRSPPAGDQKSRALILTARLCALAAILTGLAKLVAIFSGWDLGIDQWLFASKLTSGLEPPNRIAPNSALNFLLLGGALLLVDVKIRSVRRGVEFATVVVGIVSLLAILGYAYGIQRLYRLGPFSPMAVHTAITFLILSVGFLLSHTDTSLLAVFAGDSTGGKLARRLLPVAILTPALLGWLSRLGEEVGINEASCDAAQAMGNIMVFTILICWSAQRLFNADIRRKQAEAATRESEATFTLAFEHAPIGMAMLSPDGRWLKVNPALCEMVGYSEPELLALTFQSLTPPGEIEAGREAVRRLVTGETRSCELQKHYVHQRGHLIAVSINVSLVRDGQGQPRYLIAQTRDVTERERAETALQESKRFLRAALDALSAHIAILDENGVIVEVNAAWGRFAGQNGFQGGRRGVGDNYLQVCDAAAAGRSEDDSAVAVGIRDVIAGKSDEFQLEYPCHGPMERRWFLVRVTRFGGDGPVRVVVAHEDITVRKKSEDEVRLNEQRYRSLVEATAAIVWTTDGSGQFAVEQPDWTAFTGQIFQELRGWGWLKAIHPDDQTKTARAWSVAVANRSVFQVEHRVRTQGGTYRDMLVRAAPIVAEHGPTLEWIGIHSDITERKQAEAWRTQLAAIIESSEDAIVGNDLDSRVTSWNAAAERMFGYSAREIVGTSIRRLIPLDREAEGEQIMSSIARGKPVLHLETVRLTKSGSMMDVSITVSPIRNAAGNVVGASRIVRNITEEKRAEAELLWKTAFLEAQVGSSLDGVLVVDGQGKKLLQNQRFTDLLKIPRHIADDPDDEKQVLWVKGMTKNPAAFIVKVTYLLSHPDETSRDEIELTDGSVLDRYSAPVVGDDGTYFGRIWTFRDITVRKRTEETLRLLGSAVEQSKESIMITDAELDLPGPRIVFVNPAFTHMTGYTAEEVVGKTPRVFQGPRTDRKVLDRLRQNLEAGEVFEGETINYRKDGSSFVLAWQIAPIREGNGPITHFVAIERDITEQTRSEALLLESQQRLALATESAHIGIWDWNVVENKMVWDAQMLALYGLRPQDFSGAVDAWQNGLHREDRERAENEIASALTGPHDFRSEFRVVWPGGEVHDIQAHGVVQRAADGSPTRMIGVNWDVTARRRTEARYRRLVESNAQGIFFWTATGEITGANDAFLSLTGYSREDQEAGRIDWVALTPPEYAERDRRVVAEIAATGSCLPYEKEFVRKDGTRVPILLGAAAFEDDPEAGVCFVLDLTERKRLETQLVQSQKMETVGKLAGGIAHEFNSILTAIIGQSELLLSDLPAGSPLATNATEITKAAGRAAVLTRQLLAYGRKQLLQPETLDLGRIITSMEGVFHHLMGEEIDTRVISIPGLHAVKADAAQLEQVIMNMAINARDAMPGDGMFTLETANVSFDQESVNHYAELKPGDYVMLAITDTGTGMSAEVKERVFEPFFSTKGVGRGTGLGLSTCYGIIKQSGGHISVYSELARGTVFKIYLPQVEQPAKAPVTRAASPELPGGTETILLVEDDSALREMAAGLLKRLGYEVLAAANGIEALNLKQQRVGEHIDLLFTDVVMPQMSGKELAERVLALSPHTRILFASAYTENAIFHQEVLNKDVALLQKPFLPSVLAHKLREVLDQPGDAVARD